MFHVLNNFFLPGNGWNWLESSGFVEKGLESGEKLKFRTPDMPESK
jgi:hypothetical protein